MSLAFRWEDLLETILIVKPILKFSKNEFSKFRFWELLHRLRKLQFAFNFPLSPFARPTEYNAKEILQEKKIYEVYWLLCDQQVLRN